MKPILFLTFRILLIYTLLSTSVAGIAQSQPINAFSTNILSGQIRMNLPREIKHVDQAVLYVLGATPYKLALGYPASGSASIVAMQPVPPEAFAGEVMTIAEALLMLIGEDNQLLIDPNHHFISFEQIHSYNKTEKEVI